MLNLAIYFKGLFNVKKNIFFISTLVLSTNLYAVPNAWETNFRQGGYNVYISDKNNNMLDFGCMLGDSEEEGTKWHNLTVTYKGKEIQNHKSLSFFVDNKKTYKPIPTAIGHVDRTNWNYFLEAMPKAKKIEVYYKNQMLFVLNPRNGIAEISEITVCSL